MTLRPQSTRPDLPVAKWVIPRPALMERLEGGAAGPVTVVAAPAGSGKTVLVRSWLAHRQPKQQAAWVSVERGERDPQRFWARSWSSCARQRGRV